MVKAVNPKRQSYVHSPFPEKTQTGVIPTWAMILTIPPPSSGHSQQEASFVPNLGRDDTPLVVGRLWVDHGFRGGLMMLWWWVDDDLMMCWSSNSQVSMNYNLIWCSIIHSYSQLIQLSIFIATPFVGRIPDLQGGQGKILQIPDPCDLEMWLWGLEVVPWRAQQKWGSQVIQTPKRNWDLAQLTLSPAKKGTNARQLCVSWWDWFESMPKNDCFPCKNSPFAPEACTTCWATWLARKTHGCDRMWS